MKPLTIIAGPTAVGKSAVALAVARAAGAAIVSADSMQVYHGLAIGTAQPSASELAEVRHYLVGHVKPGEDYNVARFVKEANHALEEEAAAGRRAIICGGTGLFLKHLVQGIFEGAPRSDEIRGRLQEELERNGPEALRERLRLVDPVRESEINPNDTMRVLRALEVFELTGVPMSEHHARDAAERAEREARYFVLTRPREQLYARIEQRVDAMIEGGWIEEARWLMGLGLPKNCQACKALGYRELFAYLRGERSLDETVAEIKLRTRQFAKRQLTWFRAVPGAEWIDLDAVGEEEVIARVLAGID